ncbi:MAG: alpha-2-macroglobulin [Deltaproteobacteria bacterium]|nr:alpha-2-macroglobulin [Deltaproteobacteria bacterium]
MTRHVSFFFAVALLLAPAALRAQAGYDRLQREAERLYARGSYRKAHDLYAKADKMKLTPPKARWVDFRLADTLWRCQSERRADRSKLDQAVSSLDALIREVKRESERDRVWAEVHESLGDYQWLRSDTRSWYSAWSHYEPALDWWAGAADVELARARYIGMAFRCAAPPWRDSSYYYGYHGNYLPLPVIDNLLQIVRDPGQRAHALFLKAMGLRYQGGSYEQRARVPEAFEEALRHGQGTDWYDDALFHYAQHLESEGRLVQAKDGTWRSEVDYPGALVLYRRLMREFKKGETRYWLQAKERIADITRADLSLGVSHVFLPGSEIQLSLGWRNVKRIELQVTRVDLTRDVAFGSGDGSGSWLQRIDLGRGKQERRWVMSTGDTGKHLPGGKSIHYEGKLPTGAYVVEAKGGGLVRRDLILVSDASAVVKSAGKKAAVYLCNALDGSPLVDATVSLWQRRYVGGSWSWKRDQAHTGTDGLARFELDVSASSVELFAAGRLADRQAFSTGYCSSAGASESWKIYAFTDRPAYRPEDEVQWKIVARTHDGATYSTPAGKVLEWEITGPRGAKKAAGKAKLNAFGSAWDKLELNAEMALGEYRISFWTEGRRRHVGSATLFRLEEYKLPEFSVSVQVPQEAGRPKIFRTGDSVEAEIQVDYYFGGAVVGAEVEVIVTQKPYYAIWRPARDYPWYYGDIDPQPYAHYGYASQIKREKLKTDGAGKAIVRFDTPLGAQQDLEYRIEARVTDSSRREVIGAGTVRVARQAFRVFAQPRHFLHRPDEDVRVDFRARDANDEPVRAEGTVTVTRERWREIWLDDKGASIEGVALKRAREKHRHFPLPGWRFKFRGYEHEKVLEQKVHTSAKGEAEFAFRAPGEGYYAILWRSPQKGRSPIEARTAVWAATPGSSDLGYYHGGLEIVVDKDTFSVGQKARALICAEVPGRFVLFSIEGDQLYDLRLVKLDGNVGLVELGVIDAYVPNIYLAAASVHDRQLTTANKQIVVPPEKHFLQVDVRADRKTYRPREQARLKVTARDYLGKPVRAELALGLVDESVFYIQSDYAPDPRQFFFGTKRGDHVSTQSTFQYRGYIRLVDTGKGLVDERQVEQQLAQASLEAQQPPADMGGADDMRAEECEAAPMAKSAAPGRAARERRRDAGPKKSASMPAPEAVAPPGPPGGGAAAEPAVVVRTDFRATALFVPDLQTDHKGLARAQARMPDSLTSWKATARAATSDDRFGIAASSVRTRQPLIARLQAPRFFVVGDEATVSAVVNNNTSKAIRAKVKLAASGVKLLGLPARTVRVPAGADARVDWRVRVAQAGKVVLRTSARGGGYADAMEKPFVAHEHGIEKTLVKAGKLRGSQAQVQLDLPPRRKGSTRLEIQIAPSLAVTMLDALPFLIDYPYGCTEQTMSRFLPAVIVARSLEKLGISPADVMHKVFGGVEPKHAAKTHPRGKRDLGELATVIQAGMDRLIDFQHGDGGWGWWKTGDSDRFMSAYVVWGLSLAQQAGVQFERRVLDRGVSYLEQHLVDEELNLDRQAWMLHALSTHHALTGRRQVQQYQHKAFDNLWNHRTQLDAYTLAMLALSAVHYKFKDKAEILIENLENTVRRDEAPDRSVVMRGPDGKRSQETMATARWGADGFWWRFSEGPVESTAFVLRALLAYNPKHPLIDPAVNWLVKNRRGAQWTNTRDTAIAVLALTDFLHASGEIGSESAYTLEVNGRRIADRKLRGRDLVAGPSRFDVDARTLKTGANRIVIRKRKGAALYFSARADFFSLEKPIPPAGHEIFARRQYYRWLGRPSLLKGTVYERKPLDDGGSLVSGDRVEVVVTVESKNNYEYLVFEDLKPAGLEAVEVRSGQPLFAREIRADTVDESFGAEKHGRKKATWKPALSSAGFDGRDYTGRSHRVHQELRDRKVALFVDKLEQGIWELRYDLRAEVPGYFHALPLKGFAMYVPELKCNSAEVRMTVYDRD